MAIYSLFGAVLAGFYAGPPAGFSFLAGGLFILASFGGLVLVWSLIFGKKSIALAVLVIIFKYVILGLILWSLTLQRGFSLLGFVLGLGALIFAILGAALIKSFWRPDAF